MTWSGVLPAPIDHKDKQSTHLQKPFTPPFVAPTPPYLGDGDVTEPESDMDEDAPLERTDKAPFGGRGRGGGGRWPRPPGDLGGGPLGLLLLTFGPSSSSEPRWIG